MLSDVLREISRENLMSKLWLIVALVCAIGCGREERQINNSSSGVAEEAARLQQENKELRGQLNAVNDKKAADEKQKRQDYEEWSRCRSLDYAKEQNPEGLKIFLAKKELAQLEFNRRVDERAKKTAEASVFSNPPASDFPDAPFVDWAINVRTTRLSSEFSDFHKKCFLKEEDDYGLHAAGGFSDWKHFLNEVSENFKDNEDNEDLGYDDYRSSMRTMERFDTPASARIVADKALEFLVKNPSSMQWAIGMALRLGEPQFVRVRLQRLYKASQIDFVKLDQELAAAIAKYMAENPEAKEDEIDGKELGPDFEFAIMAPDGNYYKGLVYRYWRWKESQEKGAGDKAVLNLQKVIKQVAKGMKVNLQ